MKHSLKDWVLATRPWSFPASVMPVLVTATWVVSYGWWTHGWHVEWWMIAAAVVNIVLVHAAGNAWSDYFDFRRGVDSSDTCGSDILTSGKFKPSEIMTLASGLMVLAVGMGLVMVCLTGIELLWIGIIGVAFALSYPFFKYRAMGDIVIFICYAVLPMIGTAFMLTGNVIKRELIYAVPVGLITTAILHANNTRDIETDAKADIVTFPILVGRLMSTSIYIAEVIIPYLWVALCSYLELMPWSAVLALLSMPLAVSNSKKMFQHRKKGRRSIAHLDESTAKLQLLFSLLLIVGMVLNMFIH